MADTFSIRVGGSAIWEHDCSECRFLGSAFRHEGDEHGPIRRAYDVWLHERDEDSGGTVMARFGSEGPDYDGFPLSVAQLVARQEQDSKWIAVTNLVYLSRQREC